MLLNCALSFFSSSGVSAMRARCATYLMLKSDEAMGISLNLKSKVQSPKWRNFSLEAQQPLFLVKLPLDERFEFGDGLRAVGAADMEDNFAAGAGRQHHQAHNAFAVDFFAVLFHENIARELVRGLHKKRRRPGMDAQLI